MRDQVSKSKALDEITNAIVGKRKRDGNDDDEIDNSEISKNGKIEPMVRTSLVSSPLNDLCIHL